MSRRLITCFKSFDSFILLQYGLRRWILDLYYRFFQKHIVDRLTKQSTNTIDTVDFMKSISSILHLPENIVVNDAERKTIVSLAEETVNGTYNLLGSGNVNLDPIDWHTDFKSGYRWIPGFYFKKYQQEEIGTSSDVKISRELSRCHHLLKLAVAYRLTLDEKYSAFCVSHIENWIDNNPLMYSINWGCTMDVAIRAVNWIWTLGLIADSKELNEDSLHKIKSSLFQHGWFIYRNPEKEPYNNSNHYLADLAGQIHLGLLFRGQKEPEKWLNKGCEELFREIRLQILPTGMSYERTTNYNRLVLELLLIPILIMKRNGYEIPSDIWYRFEKMFDFIMYTIKPDGTSPIIGDQDNGRLLPFGVEEINSFRYLLSLGALLFGRTDFKKHGDNYNIYCAMLAGEEAFGNWHTIPDLYSSLKSKSFSDSGIYIMRDNDNYLLFNATGKGLYPELGTGTHTHSDLFSFELFTNGRTFLVDPGSYVYTANADQRMLFRSTKMHNTVTIDGKSQNHICREDLWDFRRDAIPDVLRWISDNDSDFITAVHDGYTRLQDPVFHERTIIFNKIQEKWTIKDFFKGKGCHTYEWFFHFDAGIDFEITGNTVRTACKDDNNITLVFEPKPGLILGKERSFVSKSYGMKEDSYVLTGLLKETVPTGLTIEILKYK